MSWAHNLLNLKNAETCNGGKYEKSYVIQRMLMKKKTIFYRNKILGCFYIFTEINSCANADSSYAL